MKNSNVMNILKKFSISILFVTILVFPLLTSAQPPGPVNPPAGGPVNPPAGGPVNSTITFPISNPFKCTDKGGCDLISLIKAILNNIIMPIAAVGVVLFIIYAGFSFVVAQGNEKKVTEAKQMLLWGLIGAGILLGAAGIATVVKNTVNQLIVP